MLFQEGAGVSSSNNFKITWTAPDNKVPTEEMVNITIKTISPPEYYIQNIRNGKLSYFNSDGDDIYEIYNMNLLPRDIYDGVTLKKLQMQHISNQQYIKSKELREMRPDAVVILCVMYPVSVRVIVVGGLIKNILPVVGVVVVVLVVVLEKIEMIYLC